MTQWALLPENDPWRLTDVMPMQSRVRFPWVLEMKMHCVKIYEAHWASLTLCWLAFKHNVIQTIRVFSFHKTLSKKSFLIKFTAQFDKNANA